MGQGITPIGTKLYFSKTDSNYTQFCRIKSYGDIGGEPNTVDTTDLEDTMDTSVEGTQSGGSTTMVANYNKTDYAAVLEDANTPGYYALAFSDGSAIKWQGSHSVGLVGHGVNEAPEFNIFVTISSVPTHVATFTPTGA